MPTPRCRHCQTPIVDYSSVVDARGEIYCCQNCAVASRGGRSGVSPDVPTCAHCAAPIVASDARSLAPPTTITELDLDEWNRVLAVNLTGVALELAPRGICVNVIAPGLTDTPMTRAIPGHIERGLEAVPQGALVAANDVAALAVHLMSDDARSVTGSVFTIDAGRTAV